MRIYSNCKSCQQPISKWIIESDRPTFKKNHGDLIQITCTKCSSAHDYSIQDFEARENKLILIIGLIILFAGTSAIFYFLKEYVFRSNYIYSIIAILAPIGIPAITYILLNKNEANRVRTFNKS